MNINVTRQVISDLWPLYASGEASADTRALVENFLAADPGLARALRGAGEGTVDLAAPPALDPDHGLRTLVRTRRRLRGYAVLLVFAMIFTCLAFGRIVADTSFDVSPRNFIVTASIAGAFWIAFFVTLLRMRASILVVPGRS